MRFVTLGTARDAYTFCCSILLMVQSIDIPTKYEHCFFFIFQLFFDLLQWHLVHSPSKKKSIAFENYFSIGNIIAQNLLKHKPNAHLSEKISIVILGILINYKLKRMFHLTRFKVLQLIQNNALNSENKYLVQTIMAEYFQFKSPLLYILFFFKFFYLKVKLKKLI